MSTTSILSQIGIACLGPSTECTYTTTQVLSLLSVGDTADVKKDELCVVETLFTTACSGPGP